MIQTQYGSHTFYLFPWWPNQEHGVITTFVAYTDIDRGKTGREAKKFYRRGIYLNMQFRAALQRDDFFTLRNALQDYTDEPVAIPFWPGKIPVADRFTPRWQAGLSIAFEPDWSNWEISDNTTIVSFTPSNQCLWAPLLVGQFARQPEADMITPRDGQFLVDFLSHGFDGEEADFSDYCVRSSLASSFDDGPTVGGITPKIFPLRAHFEGIQASTTVSVDSRTLGNYPIPQKAVYPQNPDRTINLAFRGHNEDAATLVKFFQDHYGPVQNFWLPTWFVEALPTQDIGEFDTSVHVDRAANLGDNRYITIADSDKYTVSHIASIVSNQLNLDVAPGSFRKEDTFIASAPLARFNQSSLRIHWTHESLFDARIQFQEVTSEYLTPAGEILGDTVGNVGQEAYLYKFWLDYDTPVPLGNLSSFDQVVLYDSVFWNPAPIDHGDIIDDLNLVKSRTTLNSRHYTDNPLSKFHQYRLEGPMMVQIIRWTATAAGVFKAAKVVFTGRVGTPKFDGPFIQCSVTAGEIFEQLVPSALVQPTCNLDVYSPRCGLSLANWKFTTQGVSYAEGPPVQLTLDTFSWPQGVLPAIFLHYFAGGRLEFGSGGNLQQAYILDSTALAGGQLTLTLDFGLDPAPSANDTIYLWPGCDGRAKTCQAYNASTNPTGKFNNYSRYFGFEHMPIASPTLIPVRKVKSSGGKK